MKIISDIYMTLKTSRLLDSKWSWRAMVSCYTDGQIICSQYFTHIVYKDEDRKREMRNSVGQILLNGLQLHWKAVFYFALQLAGLFCLLLVVASYFAPNFIC